MAVPIITLITIVVAIPGAQKIVLLIQFYMGQRCDLFITQNRGWLAMGSNGCLFLIPAMLVGSVGVAIAVTPIACLVVYPMIFLAPIPMFFIEQVLRRFPPAWLQNFFTLHSEDEREVIHRHGRALMKTHPGIFQEVIRTQSGFESWLLTITQETPITLFDWKASQAEKALKKQKYSKANDFANEILDGRLDHVRGYFLRAQAHFGDKTFAAAIRDYDRCIELEPRNAEFYAKRAEAHLMLDQLDEAEADIQKATELQPHDPLLRILEKEFERRQEISVT